MKEKQVNKSGMSSKLMTTDSNGQKSSISIGYRYPPIFHSPRQHTDTHTHTQTN